MWFSTDQLGPELEEWRRQGWVLEKTGKEGSGAAERSVGGFTWLRGCGWGGLEAK